MISNQHIAYYLTHEESSLIRNLLHKEDIEYKYVKEGREDAQYFNTIRSAISAMEHPQEHKPVIS